MARRCHACGQVVQCAIVKTAPLLALGRETFERAAQELGYAKATATKAYNALEGRESIDVAKVHKLKALGPKSAEVMRAVVEYWARQTLEAP